MQQVQAQQAGAGPDVDDAHLWGQRDVFTDGVGQDVGSLDPFRCIPLGSLVVEFAHGAIMPDSASRSSVWRGTLHACA